MTKREMEALIDTLSDKLTEITKELDVTKQQLQKGEEEELYKWLPISDDVYWTDYDIANVLSPSLNKIQTIVTNGARIYTYHECNLGWGTMAKSGEWKYMRIKL